jgi:acyl carrier protein
VLNHQTAPHVRQVLLTLVSKRFLLELEDLQMESRFVEDLGADSLDLVDIVASLEDQLRIKISEQEIIHMPTLGDAVRYLSERLAQSTPAPLPNPDV